MILKVRRTVERFQSASARFALALIVFGACVSLSGILLAGTADDYASLSRDIPALTAKGEFDQAKVLAERYVAQARAADGEESPEYASAISWLAFVSEQRQEGAQAERLLKQALSIRENAFGPNHPLVATSKTNLASLYRHQGRKQEAVRLEAQAHEARGRAVGLSVLEVLPREIRHLQADGKAREAAALARQYLALARDRYGADQPAVVPVLADVAHLFEQQGKLVEAEALLDQALEIQSRVFGPRSPEVADSAEALGRIYRLRGRDEKAVAALKRALSIRKAVYGVRNEKTIRAMEALGSAYEAQGRQEEADQLLAEAKSLWGQVQRKFSFARQEPSHAVVNVFYATDRENTGAKDPAEMYGGERGSLRFGVASVSIPRDHRMGALETPSVWRFEWWDDPDRFVVLLSAKELDEARFFDDVAARVDGSSEKSAFIFVHGYNVAFVDAARRTAQMAYDLGFDGAPVLYSWPSQASFAAYKVDESECRMGAARFQRIS